MTKQKKQTSNVNIVPFGIGIAFATKSGKVTNAFAKRIKSGKHIGTDARILNGRMKKMNNGNYSGRMAKDFSLVSSGKMGTGTVAVDRPFPFGKDKDGNQITDFLTIKIIGEDKAKRAEKYLLKGTKIAFTGITCRDASKDESGNWKEFNYIMITDWEFAESKNSSSGSAAAPEANSDGWTNAPDAFDSELPFN